MPGYDPYADDRREACGQHRAGDPHVQREDEEIVHQDIGKAAGQHGGHGQPRSVIVPHKADQDIVQQKGRGEEQEDLQVCPCHGKDLLGRPQ